jgi:pseudouridine-5'-phosphate glycosidase
MLMKLTDYLTLEPQVAAALAEKRPVVALESTVISHGLPWPDNLAIARRMEAAIRASGAVPATIALLDGVIHVGLSEGQLEKLARLPGGAVRKCSRRDFAIAIARRENGATTVAGTMVVAHLAGIELFATGGIGGVHRGAPFDVSADLTEMGRTPVTVVCSGAKSILDLPATREVLETQGVTVVGYGVGSLPAFFSRESGLPVDVRVDSADQAARIIAARRMLGLQSAVLIGSPVPEGEGLESAEIEAAITRATAEAEAAAIHGAAVTPFLLQRLVTLTDGATLRANLALLENNARVAGQIAVALAE